MRRFAAVLTLAALVLVRAPLHAADDLLYNYFADYLDALRAQAGIPGLAAAIVNIDGSIWERPFGQQDLERGKATQTITPFHVDGLTQIVTASLVLRCVEEGRLSLDDRIGQFKPSSSDAGATVRQVLTHTSGNPDNLVFQYRPERLESLSLAIRACTGDSFRENVANVLTRIAMLDSVPGPDVINLAPPAEGIPSPDAAKRYAAVLDQLATPYSVSSSRRASPSQYTATTLTAGDGLISTVHDFARFELALRDDGALVKRETLVNAWQPPTDQRGRPLPHGMGWFVQTYNGKTIVWQFGVSENAGSSMVVSVPSRGITLILAANSDGLVKSFALTAGDVTVSPFARVFLGTFVR
jgi:CubicO group peptidase (beta-lactamase class C family)